jgi:hypothetical protein
VSDAGGANPSGQVTYHFGGSEGPTISGAVVCLSVSGTAAVVGFVGTSTTLFPPSQPVVGELVVTDNGPVGSGLDTVGASQHSPATGPPNCSAPGSVFPSGPVDAGDVIVQPARARMVGKGSVSGTSGTAAYAYILQ